MYVLRLDDATPCRNMEAWDKIEELLDRYEVRPIVGVIPQCRNPKVNAGYAEDPDFWDRAKAWQEKGWRIALHGFDHVFCSNQGGLNPVNRRSEFAGVPAEKQLQKIRDGYRILKEHGLNPDMFFAPAHTFDQNTLDALESETDIRIISDTFATDTYRKGGFYYIPQQSGRPRTMPFAVVTICLHPNKITDVSYQQLEAFIRDHRAEILDAKQIPLRDKPMTCKSRLLRAAYLTKRKFQK